MRKIFFVLASLVISSNVYANTLSCKVTKVIDNSVFEESLSVEEYPEVTLVVDGFNDSLNIGSSQYAFPDLISVRALPTVGFDQEFEIILQEGKTSQATITISVGPDGKGILATNSKAVADMTCK